MNLVKYPDPVLSQVAKEIAPEDINGSFIKHVIMKMYSVMSANEGIGIACPQVGLSWRMFIAFDKIWINPTVEAVSGTKYNSAY